MKALKKTVFAALMCAMLVIPFFSTASAAGLFDPDNINSIAQYFNIDLNDPESVQGAIDEIQQNGLSGIMGIFGIDVSAIVEELEKHLSSMETTAVAEEATTIQETTTEIISTTEEVKTTEPTTIAVATTIVEKPVYMPVTQKPAETTNEKVEITEDEFSAEITTVETTENITTSPKNTTIQQVDSNSADFSSNTIFTVFSTVIIFALGIITGIAITKYLSNKPHNKEE